MLSYEHIKKYAAEAGFTLCGVARARVLTEHVPRYEAGLAAGGEACMEYLARNYSRRFDPRSILKGAKTVVVCALAYPRVEYPEGFTGGKRASFAHIGEEYHVRIKRMLREVFERLQNDAVLSSRVVCPEAQRADGSHSLRAKFCCDTAPILEKAWAVEAGLGWQGRNSLLVNPVHGSFMSLGELLLDAESDCYDKPYEGSGCGNCRACIEACPTGALGEAAGGIRTLSTALCISSRTVERLRLCPDGPSEAIHGWIYGCDECQTACPKNRKIPAAEK